MSSEVTQETKCRVIAEWLGWKPNESRTRWHSPACQRSEVLCGGKVPDFYRDEAANALILEKMPEPMLMRDCDTWKCAPKDYSFTMDTKRLHAIADAGYALALREREGR